ncbi:unnamed protein product [Vitrella brassicaformis CCMP3155]|uniref:Uncharacterized protein n=2 Tax=Vitrella brassicaformis TaxID=1169539 RepID=A0A0G4FH94_VITBC|nr:unnamed protein product [Vitrella brassicaformis CCMP3155]|eukprot:CEM12879.1 unnamed protein product [Vitrella brassicaformis CCMP3155]
MVARARGKQQQQKAKVRGVDFPDYTRQPSPGGEGQKVWERLDVPQIRVPSDVSLALPWVAKPQIGDGTLVGDFGFDPLGLSKIADVGFLRNAELKHGRLCMLAAVGLLAPELVQKPAGFDGLEFVPAFSEMNPFKALFAMPPAGLMQILIAIALIELNTAKFLWDPSMKMRITDMSEKERLLVQTGNTRFLAGSARPQLASLGNEVVMEKSGMFSRVPGDLGFDPLGLADEGIREDWALAEIKHGRLAMLAVLGMLLQVGARPDKGILEMTGDWLAGNL